jgi:hypothetical protein
MPRLLLLICLAAGLSFAAEPRGDSNFDDLELLIPRENRVTFGVRFLRGSKVTFKNLGTIATTHSVGNLTDEVARTYNDGSVGLDARTFADGGDLPDDGRTNTWNFRNASQVASDQSGIAFHNYSAKTNGAGLSTNSGLKGGMDLEYSRRFGDLGRRNPDVPATVTWGAALGVGLTDVNGKTRGSVRATLNSVTDTYSLFGATPPTVGDTGYSAPSSSTESITNADGTTASVTFDTTTYLANRPDSRTETTKPDGAEVNGYWQVRGAYFSLRAGPWLRWQPTEKLALRLSAGGTMSLVGLRMRYDERLMLDGLGETVSATEETDTRSMGLGGLFSAVDAEWALTHRTGIFAGASYEYMGKSPNLTAGDRSAQVKMSSGVGVRFGLSTRF